MQFKNVNFVSPAQCPYTIDGRKLIEIRRSNLLATAAALGIEELPTLGKSDMVVQMIAKLSAMDAPHELNELKTKPKKKRAAKK